MSRHDPMVSVHHMLDRAREAVDMVRRRSRPHLGTDRMLDLALVRLMEAIGQAAARIPEGFQSRHPRVPWPNVADLGTCLIKGYDTVDLDRLWAIIQEDLPPLTGQLQAIVQEEA